MNTLPHGDEKERFDPLVDEDFGRECDGVRDQSHDPEHVDPHGVNIDPDSGEVHDAV